MIKITTGHPCKQCMQTPPPSIWDTIFNTLTEKSILLFSTRNNIETPTLVEIGTQIKIGCSIPWTNRRMFVFALENTYDIVKNFTAIIFYVKLIRYMRNSFRICNQASDTSLQLLSLWIHNNKLAQNYLC